ncbi:Os01g0762601 [Oryza sativa Japonica Group]|uniref:Os01g0762601 protein n=1 Tax=Oryza sativa subsp. japonica TaxID=39947 RepID=A0A0P0V8H4_ORYSJ|nr:hypothetical protein EE612_005893 [Oryza sativa]BAS74469.1 Os01g0762601 [Oryza sativa Japonica Group]
MRSSRAERHLGVLGIRDRTIADVACGAERGGDNREDAALEQAQRLAGRRGRRGRGIARGGRVVRGGGRVGGGDGRRSRRWL